MFLLTPEAEPALILVTDLILWNLRHLGSLPLCRRGYWGWLLWNWSLLWFDWLLALLWLWEVFELQSTRGCTVE